MQRIDLRLTLHWKGWGVVTDDGWTKLTMTCDKEAGRWTRQEVIETNGVKNADIWKAAAITERNAVCRGAQLTVSEDV